MPTAAKSLDSMNKNLTNEEREIREKVEASIMPDRGGSAALVPPPMAKANTAAMRYWSRILEQMEGLSILDDLDSDTLGVYCIMLSRYEEQCKLLRKVKTMVSKAKDDSDAVSAAISKMDAVSGKMQSLERNILQYAEKLGLTPSGRVRLAQKRAAALIEPDDPDGDLYGY